MNKHERIGAGGEMNLREMLTPHTAGKDFLPECYDIKKLCGCLGNPGAFEIIRSRVLEAAEGSPSACKHIRFKLHNLADTFFLDEQGMMRFYRIFKDYFQEAQLDDVIDYLNPYTFGNDFRGQDWHQALCHRLCRSTCPYHYRRY